MTVLEPQILPNLSKIHNSQAPEWLEVRKGSLAKKLDLVTHDTWTYLTLLIKISAASQV